MLGTASFLLNPNLALRYAADGLPCAVSGPETSTGNLPVSPNSSSERHSARPADSHVLRCKYLVLRHSYPNMSRPCLIRTILGLKKLCMAL